MAGLEVEVKFNVFVECAFCSFRQLASDLVTHAAGSVEVVGPVLQPEAEVEVEEVGGEKLVTFRCRHCRRRRYLDESITAVIAKPGPDLRAVG